MNHAPAANARVLLRSTGICPVCLAKVPSAYVRMDRAVYYCKYCPRDGESTFLISRDAGAYEELFELHHGLGLDSDRVLSSSPDQVTVFPTTRCNLNCPICFAHTDAAQRDISVDDVLAVVRRFKNKKINLLGGEATVYRQLPSLIEAIKRSGNIPVLFTNGIKFADRAYAEELFGLGIREVHLQFDGVQEETYRRLRQAELLAIKFKALDHAQRLGMKVVLEALIDGNVNAGDIGEIIRFALSFPNIKGINFRTYFILGKKNDEQGLLLLDDLLRLCAEQTGNKIRPESIREFQKVLYIIAKIFSLKMCLKHRYFVVYRTEGGFDTINELFGLDYLAPVIKRFGALLRKARLPAYAYLVLAALSRLPLMLNRRNIGLACRYAAMLISKRVLRSSIHKRMFSDSSLMVSFEKPCDLATFDLREPCDNMVIDAQARTFPTFYYASICRERERTPGAPDKTEALMTDAGAKPLVSFFIPFYNEGALIRKNVEIVRQELSSRFGNRYELTLVDDCSNDRSSDVAREMSRDGGFKVVRFTCGPSRRENLAQAMKASQGSVICFFDMDLSSDLLFLEPLIRKVATGEFDVAIGNRYNPASRIDRSWGRTMISLCYNACVRLLWHSRLHDHQCGFKAFKRECLLSLIEEAGYDSTLTRSWFWDTEILLRAQQRSYRIEELPIQWKQRANEIDWIAFALREYRIAFYIARNLRRLRIRS